MALEETGVSLVVEGEDSFQSALDSAGGAVDGFGDLVGNVSGGVASAFDEIITGALRRVGEFAIETLASMGQAVIEFGKDAFEGALEAEEGIARLTGAIRRAGDDSPVTEERALELADAYKELAGGSDDAVIAAQAVLLKFQSINEDAFEPALNTTLDLAAIMGIDAAAAAEQLGRALEDPERATRLLKAAGVVLTDQEKEQIKAWTESGDAASAQAFILDKLSKASAGAAADLANTTGGQLAIFQESIADAGETIATAFLPILQRLFNDYLKPLLPVIEKLADDISTQVLPAFAGLQGMFTEFLPVIQPVIAASAELGRVLIESFPAMQSAGEDFAAWFLEAFGITVPKLVNDTTEIIQTLTNFWENHGQTVVDVISATFKIITATILGALTIISGVINATLRLIGGAFDFWGVVFEGRWQDAFGIMLDTVLDITTIVIKTLVDFIQIASSIVTDGMRDAFADWAMTATSGVQEALIQAGRAILQFKGMFEEAAVQLMAGIRDGILRGIGWVLGAAREVAQRAVNEMQSVLGIHSPSTVMMELVGMPISEGIAEGIANGAGMVGEAFNKVVAPIMSPSQMGNAMGAGSSYSNTSNWNLNVNSSQSSQGIQSDFGIMQAMAG
jgi:phage-related protein